MRIGSRRVARMLLCAAALVVALGATELWLYLFGSGLEDQFLKIDEVRGWSIRPGFAGWTADENRLWIRINNDGLRDREHSREKPPRTVRIAVLGDSYMQAMNVPQSDMFATRLEEQLRGCAAPLTPEVINFGVSGYGTAQELLTFETQAAAYHPDLVVTAVYFGNDLRDNFGPLADDLAPFFTLDGNSLTLDTSFRSRLARTEDQPWRIRARMAMTYRSRAATLLYRPWVEFRAWQRGNDDGDPSEQWEEDADAFRPPDDEESEQAWRVTEAVLEKLAGVVRAAGAEPWIVSLTTATQVDPDREYRASVQRRLGVGDLFYAEHRLAKLGADRGLPTVTLALPMADYAAANHVYFHGGLNSRAPAGRGHWNPAAHQLGAELVARRLCDESAALAAARAAAR